MFLFTLLLLAAPHPVSVLQEPSGDAAPPVQAPPTREEQARNALADLRRRIAPLPSMDAAERRRHLERSRSDLARFARDWAGSAAATAARLQAAGLDLHALEQVQRGLHELDALWQESLALHQARSRPVAGVAESPQNGSLAAAAPSIGLRYGQELLDHGRSERAEAVLTAVAAMEAPESRVASDMLVRAAASAALEVGQALPEWSAPDLDGGQVAVREFAGDVLLIVFWDSRFGRCRAEMRRILQLRERHGESLSVLGVCLDPLRARAALRRFLERAGIDWPQIHDGAGWHSPLVSPVRLRALPSALLVDRAGVLRARDLQGGALEQAVVRLLADG